MTTQNAGQHAETIQDAVDEARIDYNALDNTLGGQLVQAGFIFAMLAARSAPVRLALGAANLAAGTVAAGAAVSRAVSVVADRLGERGVAKPNALLGLAGAAAYVAAKQRRA